MNSMHFGFAAVAAAALTFTVPAAAIAPLGGFDGSFETGLAGWTSTGDVSLRSLGPAAPSQGFLYVLLTSASKTSQDDFPVAAGVFNFSGTAAADVAVLQLQLGVAPGALDPDPVNFVSALEGSIIQRSLVVQAGSTLSFDWNFLTNESGPAPLPDYAFVSINGNLTRLADTASVLQPSSFFTLATGYQTTSIVFASDATVVLGFGVVDVSDFTVTSALAIDNIQITPVPEPQTYALLLVGLATLGALVRKRRR
ncbi:MAG: PEP-CTERM sorting domain-containing protein [Rhodoferax sp.]|nr:PEP-CTERM sorting domain-containing protein [Rhodoferax sp.]